MLGRCRRPTHTSSSTTSAPNSAIEFVQIQSPVTSLTHSLLTWRVSYFRWRPFSSIYFRFRRKILDELWRFRTMMTLFRSGKKRYRLFVQERYLLNRPLTRHVFVSFRHHCYKKIEGGKQIELKEVGPRFEMQCRPLHFDPHSSSILNGIGCTVCYSLAVFEIYQGTLETKDSADVEWVYKPYMRTTKKRRFMTKEWRTCDVRMTRQKRNQMSGQLRVVFAFDNIYSFVTQTLVC